MTCVSASDQNVEPLSPRRDNFILSLPRPWRDSGPESSQILQLNAHLALRRTDLASESVKEEQESANADLESVRSYEELARSHEESAHSCLEPVRSGDESERSCLESARSSSESVRSWSSSGGAQSSASSLKLPDGDFSYSDLKCEFNGRR
jgi:hypothetical protein